MIDDSVSRKPSVEQLDVLLGALKRFAHHDQQSGHWSRSLAEQQRRLPGFVGLVKVLRPLRELTEMPGWPASLPGLVAIIVENFGGIARLLEWEKLVGTDEEIEAEIARCNQAFRTAHIPAIQEAARYCCKNYTDADRPLWLEIICETEPKIEYNPDVFHLFPDARFEPLRQAVFAKEAAGLYGKGCPMPSEHRTSKDDFKEEAALIEVLRNASYKLGAILSVANEEAIPQDSRVSSAPVGSTEFRAANKPKPPDSPIPEQAPGSDTGRIADGKSPKPPIPQDGCRLQGEPDPRRAS